MADKSQVVSTDVTSFAPSECSGGCVFFLGGLKFFSFSLLNIQIWWNKLEKSRLNQLIAFGGGFFFHGFQDGLIEHWKNTRNPYEWKGLKEVVSSNHHEVQICYTHQENRMIVQLYRTSCRFPKVHHICFRWNALKLAASTSKNWFLPFEFNFPSIFFQMHLPIKNQSFSTSVVYALTRPTVFLVQPAQIGIIYTPKETSSTPPTQKSIPSPPNKNFYLQKKTHQATFCILRFSKNEPKNQPNPTNPWPHGQPFTRPNLFSETPPRLGFLKRCLEPSVRKRITAEVDTGELLVVKIHHLVDAGDGGNNHNNNNNHNHNHNLNIRCYCSTDLLLAVNKHDYMQFNDSSWLVKDLNDAESHQSSLFIRGFP